MIRGFAALIVLLAILPVAMADSYEIIIQPDNTASVTAVIEGKGLHALELPKDAVPEIKGALYLKKGNVLELSIGSTEKATVNYKTKEYIKDSKLIFSAGNASVKVILPENAKVKAVFPDADASEANMLEWGSAEKIEVKYALEPSPLPEPSKSQGNIFAGIFAAVKSLFSFMFSII